VLGSVVLGVVPPEVVVSLVLAVGASVVAQAPESLPLVVLSSSELLDEPVVASAGPVVLVEVSPVVVGSTVWA